MFANVYMAEKYSFCPNAHWILEYRHIMNLEGIPTRYNLVPCFLVLWFLYSHNMYTNLKVRQTVETKPSEGDQESYYSDDEYEDPMGEYESEDETTTVTESNFHDVPLRENLYNSTEVKALIVDAPARRPDMLDEDNAGTLK